MAGRNAKANIFGLTHGTLSRVDLHPAKYEGLTSVRCVSPGEREPDWGASARCAIEGTSIHEIVPIRRMNSEGGVAHRADDAR